MGTPNGAHVVAFFSLFLQACGVAWTRLQRVSAPNGKPAFIHFYLDKLLRFFISFFTGLRRSVDAPAAQRERACGAAWTRLRRSVDAPAARGCA